MKRAACLSFVLMVGCASTATTDLSQLPPCDPAAFNGVRTANAWRNPFVTAMPDGVELTASAGGVRRTVPVEDLPAALRALPRHAWPYGRVVAVSQNGLCSGDGCDRSDRNFKRVLAILAELHLQADPWPSA